MRSKLLVATSNKGKLAELRRMLGDVEVEVLGLRDVFDTPPEIVEDGATFEENAVKKAGVVAQASGLLTLADDSGLEVDALSGRPGVHSARFAGPNASDADNNRALLAALAGHQPPYTARFRCVLALVDPAEPEAPVLTQGVCEGRITTEPRGLEGFGYDPLFVVEGLERTMAELPPETKNQLSHRGRALRAMLPELVRRLSRPAS